MYRNYDGQRSTFGETSVSATVPNPDELSAFASVRASDEALTIMVVNKANAAAPISVGLTDFAAQPSVQAWQLTGANQIARLPDLTVTGATFSNTVPAQSVTLFVVPRSIPIEFGFGIRRTASGAEIIVTGSPGGAAHRLERSGDLKTWAPAQQIVLTGSPIVVPVPLTNAAAFYRIVQE
jgi:hypothetical protein